jgi:hypothetical protein
VADEPVSREPVSEASFPAIREKYREFPVLWRKRHKNFSRPSPLFGA